MRIESTRVISSPRLSDLLRDSTIHFRMFLCMVTCFLRARLYQRDMFKFISLSFQWRETKLFDIVTATGTKPWLSRNMLPNSKTCKKEWSNFSENLTVVATKLLELTQFASLNQSIYFNFLWCWGPLWQRTISLKYSIYREVYGGLHDTHQYNVLTLINNTR